jgi:hypothetical protein
MHEVHHLDTFDNLISLVAAFHLRSWYRQGHWWVFYFCSMHQMRTHECLMISNVAFYSLYVADKIHEFYSTGKSPNFVAFLPTQLSCYVSHS